jgi:hypothetical protein
MSQMERPSYEWLVKRVDWYANEYDVVLAALKESDAANHNNAEAWSNANAIMKQRLQEAEAQLKECQEKLNAS